MREDTSLQQKALEVFQDADKHRWVHQTNWFGEPLLNLPQDMFAIQEIIFRTRPRFIIELGVAWGGSVLFNATILSVLGGERVIGVDVYIPHDLKARLSSHGRVSELITLINASSVEAETAAKVQAIIGDTRDVLLILDSNHTHAHVLAELRLYAQFVGKGHYIVCSDTIVEHIPPQVHRPREWGPGNNPKSALDEFLRKNDRFVTDETVDQKLLFTCNPGGYLRCVKD